MTILVTGSTGTIGTQVLSCLQGRGVEVRAVTRPPDAAEGNMRDDDRGADP